MSWRLVRSFGTSRLRRPPFANVARALACIVVAVQGSAAQAQPSGACDRTTAAAAGACRAQSDANRRLALAMCDNLSVAEQVRECREAAGAQFGADEKFCSRQADSRDFVCRRIGQAAYDPAIVAADFSAQITNPWMPLPVGIVMTYTVPKGRDVVEVLHRTRVIDGVECAVVRDTVTIDGTTEEDTYDYFAQDRQGNVWYFGEETTQFGPDGVPSGVVGSWLAGVDGAKSGIVMEADSRVGDAYRQEFLVGVGEDSAEVTALDKTVTVPYGTFDHVLQTLEFTGLEPGAREHKYYARGVGNVLTVDLVTGERDELVSIQHR
jgi:hypothetical protein